MQTLINDVDTLKAQFPGYCAAMVDSDGMIMDLMWSWEAAINMANDAPHVVVFNGEGHLGESELRHAVARERSDYSDCFGVTYDDNVPTIVGISSDLARAIS